MDPLNNGPNLRDEEIEKFANMINAAHRSVQFEGLLGLRTLISADDNPPIQKVVDSGIVPKLLEIMTCEDDPQFQIESSWCVLNICSGEEKFVDYILELGGLDLLMSLFDSENNEVVSNAVFSIRNISGSGIEYRDLCLQKDCMKKLLKILEKGVIPTDLLDETIFAISSLCAKQPYPAWDEVLPALPQLQKQISNRYSEIAFKNALRGLWSLSCENVQEVIDEGCVPFLVNYLYEDDPEILTPILKTLQNLLAGTEIQANMVLKCDKFLPRIFELTKSQEQFFRTEALWAISNIAAGSSNKIEMILQNDSYVEILKTALATEGQEVAEQAAWAICNMISEGDDDQIDRIVRKHGLMDNFARILTEFGEDLKKNALEGLYNILRKGNFREDAEYTEYMTKAGLVEIIQDLARDRDFREEAEDILNYFD